MNSKSVKRIARIVSNIFIPPFPTFAIFLLFSLHFENPEKTILSILLALIFTVILPISFFVWLRSNHAVSDNDATNKEERSVPYTFGLIITVIAFILSRFLEMSNEVQTLWVIYIVNTFVILAINRYWKISAHAMGVSAPAAALFYLFPLYGLFALLLVGIVGFARIKLKMHTPAQVIAGSILGWILAASQLLLVTDLLG
ncbi:MAG: hypothetical protein K9J12_01780 [Melioribacteraceae bacterium]|nr:hypothetical protein [Melioribacteraceae bacterium]MCF8264547.1 hypothetical protein [Melioribacteraceae bacterium]